MSHTRFVKREGTRFYLVLFGRASLGGPVYRVDSEGDPALPLSSQYLNPSIPRRPRFPQKKLFVLR